MVNKLIETEEGVMLLLPKETLKLLGLTGGSEVEISVQPAHNQIVITPASISLPGVDEPFARQLSDFIEKYRSALEALAR